MWSKILNVAKWIGGVVGGITAVGSIVLLIYTQGIKAEQKRSKDYTFESKVDKLMINDSVKTEMLITIAKDVGELKIGQGEIKKSTENTDKAIGIIKIQLGNHIVNTATKDDIKNWMNAWEENALKKNESYFNKIALPFQKEYWMPYTSILEVEK